MGFQQMTGRKVPFKIERIYGTKVMTEKNIMVEPVKGKKEEPIEVVDVRTRKKDYAKDNKKTRR